MKTPVFEAGPCDLAGAAFASPLARAHKAMASTAELKERFVVSPLNYYVFDICALLSIPMRVPFGTSIQGIHPILWCGPSPQGDDE
jgi:hypothetical protein